MPDFHPLSVPAASAKPYLTRDEIRAMVMEVTPNAIKCDVFREFLPTIVESLHEVPDYFG